MSYTLTQWWSPNYTKGRGGHKINKIILHHAATTNFDGIGATFQNTSRQTSAHFGVAPGHVCQYVNISDTAWHAGVWSVNQESIGIEHVNSSGAPNWDIADGTIQTGAELLANLAKQLGWNHLKIGENVFFHSDFRQTSCPCKLRDAGLGQREVDIANSILGTGKVDNPTPTPASNPVSTPTKGNTTSGGWLYFDYRGNVRDEPTTNSGVFATYDAGTWVHFDGYVHGQTVNGSDKWLRSTKSKKYVHESVTSGTFGLPDLGAVSVGHPATSTITLTHDVRGNWRDKPTTNSGIFATYDKGAAVKCIGWCYGQDPYGDGRNKWVISARSHKYAWEGIFGGVYGLSKIE